jgi:hypothetical protein
MSALDYPSIFLVDPSVSIIKLRRFREARDYLADASKLHPDQPELTHALARVLVTVPDDRVRHGERAMELVQELFKNNKSTELGETMAMTLAEWASTNERRPFSEASWKPLKKQELNGRP